MNQIKSIQDLEKIKGKALKDQAEFEELGQTQIIIGMGTPSLAAGARQTMKAILDYINEHHLVNIHVQQTGNIGLDSLEPLIRIVRNGETVTYGRVTPEIAKEIMMLHVEQGQPVESHIVDR